MAAFGEAVKDGEVALATPLGRSPSNPAHYGV